MAKSSRTKEETFWLIQEQHTNMCYSKKYHKIPFEERDRIIAKRLKLNPLYVEQARKCTDTFIEFSYFGDHYLKQSSRMAPEKLVEIVQYFCATLLSENENCKMLTLDDIISKALGYSSNYIRHARVGGDRFRTLRHKVNCKHRKYAWGDSKKTYQRVKNKYIQKLRNRNFANMEDREQNKTLAGILKLRPYTVYAIRVGRGIYKKYGGF